MKDLDDFDLDDDRDDEAGEERRTRLGIDDAADDPEPWEESGDGPSRLEDDGDLPDLPPDVTPERPLIPPLTYLLLVLIAVPVALYLLLRPGEVETPDTSEVAATPFGVAPTPTPATDATPDDAPALELPGLGESDAVVRELLAAVSAHPRLAEWLGQENLVRTFVVVVENVADGESPAPHLAFLAPDGAFQVRDGAGALSVDPASFARYDDATALVASLDVEQVARRLRELEPLTEAAYRELGHPQGGFGATLLRAIDRLVGTPVPAGGAALRRYSVNYAWADPRLESLDPAQKHLLRTGPGNQAAIQAWLQRLRDALTAPGQAAPAAPSTGSSPVSDGSEAPL